MQFRKIKVKRLDVQIKRFGMGKVIMKDTDEFSNVLLNPISDKLQFGKNIYKSLWWFVNINLISHALNVTSREIIFFTSYTRSPNFEAKPALNQ